MGMSFLFDQFAIVKWLKPLIAIALRLVGNPAIVLRLTPEFADVREWEIAAAAATRLVASSAHRLHGYRSSEA